MDDPRELVRALVRDVWNGADPSFADRVFPPDRPSAPGLPAGPEGVKAWFREERTTFPDLRYEVEDVISEGELAVLRWSATGTQRGAFGPIPPTGRTVTWTGIHIFRVRDGRFVEYWVEADSLGRLRKLGVELVPPGDDVPPSAPAAPSGW